MATYTQDDERWERAVAGRLSRLRTVPVETGPLAAAIRARVPRPAPARTVRFSLRSVRAVAASVLVVGALAAVLVFAGLARPAVASPARMAQLHEGLVSGRTPAVRVDSIEAANRVLAGGHPRFPALPDVAAGHVSACCMTEVKDKKVSCVLIKRDGVPVSLMVARDHDMHLPASPVTVRDGVRYHVQAAGHLNMVMAERDGRWVCLIGALPPDRLIDVAARLRFQP